MTSDHDHIYMVGRYRQGQHAHVTLRTQGQSQGHQGRFSIFEVFACFANSSFNTLIVGNSLEACVPWWAQVKVTKVNFINTKVKYVAALVSCSTAADPISLDMLVFTISPHSFAGECDVHGSIGNCHMVLADYSTAYQCYAISAQSGPGTCATWRRRPSITWLLHRWGFNP